MITHSLNLLLADDDTDDCFIFNEALDELNLSAKLTTVNDGVELMQLLSANDTLLPDALFLDLNMPRKDGIECLSEIKISEQLMKLPVIIYSTSFNKEVVDLLYQKGAYYYICKPSEFEKIKKVILESITLISQSKLIQPTRDKFILQP